MPEELTAEQAAARLKSADTLGIPLGPGQPPTFLQALGEREDWTDLRVYGALLAVLTELFSGMGCTTCPGSSARWNARCVTAGPLWTSRLPTSGDSARSCNGSRRA